MNNDGMIIDPVICPACGADCGDEELTSFDGEEMCEVCRDGRIEMDADCDDIDHWGYRDPSPEEQAGWAFEDKLEAYRNEY